MFSQLLAIIFHNVFFFSSLSRPTSSPTMSPTLSPTIACRGMEVDILNSPLAGIYDREVNLYNGKFRWISRTDSQAWIFWDPSQTSWIIKNTNGVVLFRSVPKTFSRDFRFDLNNKRLKKVLSTFANSIEISW